ncbi:Bacillopeptidase F, partial [Orchesella cincta]
SKPDCSKAPHVVSNSWGGGRGTTWYEPVIEAWVAGGIVPVFSIGNSGPRCDTANSVGPTVDKRMKPDISAPGSEVISAYHTSDDAYRSLSGTSMAAPHVSGVVALLLTRNEQLDVGNVKDLLFKNTDKDLVSAGTSCEGIGDDVFPNHVFGSGRLNALKSVQAQTKMLTK